MKINVLPVWTSYASLAVNYRTTFCSLHHTVNMILAYPKDSSASFHLSDQAGDLHDRVGIKRNRINTHLHLRFSELGIYLPGVLFFCPVVFFNLFSYQSGNNAVLLSNHYPAHKPMGILWVY